MNATYLFERRDSEQSSPTSKESFWTAILSFFLWHIGQFEGDKSKLTIWHPNETGNPKWYMKRKHNYSTSFSGLDFDSLTVEPLYLAGSYFGLTDDIPIELSGISPDMFVKLNKNIIYLKIKSVLPVLTKIKCRLTPILYYSLRRMELNVNICWQFHVVVPNYNLMTLTLSRKTLIKNLGLFYRKT
jgi:hypothetical protein